MSCSLGRQPQVGRAATLSAPEGRRKLSANHSFAPPGLCASEGPVAPGLAPWATRRRLFEASHTPFYTISRMTFP